MSDSKVGSITRDSFLRLMKMLESSGGKNTNHRTIASGLHEGDAAIGASGLMPNTIKEMIGRKKEKDAIDAEFLAADNADIPYLAKRFPEKTAQVESDLADRVLTTAEGDIELAATGWLYGHNNSKSRLQKLLEKDPVYKNRINKFAGSMGLQSGDLPADFPKYVEKLKRQYDNEE